ncbi:Uncharacterized conserved protein UCP033271 [Thermovirga lienii DSM 17291]|jgi:uncharacterized protein (UPF0261 family)|uniref:UPF0261 protein Tlie_1688 n=1 Tax=Thermovirga lienii (strain ATCC BAA-1197 / DSM 17291 / Cas60314) TaxID=580340 RepID=G7V879_THELD|nr:Tm-1-like ATP-binding domain-containing protein [Thermovirga lienii]AER67410.1 Uncharacterized conserved protein UCP033271 [Thermovirga lienii DSM 17291]
MKKAYVVGTCDTKYQELAYVRDLIEKAGVPTVLVDVGIFAHDNPVDVPNSVVASYHPTDKNFLEKVKDRGQAVSAMSEALPRFIATRDDLGGIIGLGGSGGTSIATAAMRALPVGIPKVMVSTVASGNVAPYVGPNDIIMMYSVTDVAGINRISRVVLGNAAHALAGMLSNEVPKAEDSKPLLGMTMFGVTTPCVNMVREKLQDEYDCLVFHATGTGGQSMEKLIDSGMMKSVIDVTLTEVCDLHMGGVMSAGEDRLGAIIRTKIPYVGSVGALDMVNFWAMDTVPEKYKNRNLYIHNPQVTLMRTTPEENAVMGKWIANKLNQCEGPVRFLLPEKGVSMIDAEGMPFYDPEADEALFKAIEENVVQTPNRKVIRLPYHINDPEFAQALVDNFKEINK